MFGFEALLLFTRLFVQVQITRRHLSLFFYKFSLYILFNISFRVGDVIT